VRQFGLYLPYEKSKFIAKLVRKDLLAFPSGINVVFKSIAF